MDAARQRVLEAREAGLLRSVSLFRFCFSNGGFPGQSFMQILICFLERESRQYKGLFRPIKAYEGKDLGRTLRDLFEGL